MSLFSLTRRGRSRLAPDPVDEVIAVKAIPAKHAPELSTTAGTGPSADSPVILEVRGLAKRFGGIAACRDLNLDLVRGKIAALVGPNGAGKTTVFNLLTGALRADAGSYSTSGSGRPRAQSGCDRAQGHGAFVPERAPVRPYVGA